MRIGIFNAYWNTRGGGELHSGAIAEILCRHHDVDLIGTEPVDLASLSESLGIDLSKVDYRIGPPLGSTKLEELTADYDLFINSTFWSSLASRARRSAYLTFFPQRFAAPITLASARVANWWLRRWLGPEALAVDGFYGVEGGRRQWQWSSGTAVIRIPLKVFRRGEARLRFLPYGPRDLEQGLVDIRGEGIEWRVEENTLTLKLVGKPNQAVDIQIESLTHRPSDSGPLDDHRQLGVCFEIGQPSGLFRPPMARHLARAIGRYLRRNDRRFLSTYDVIMANSEYTQNWIRKLWNLESEVLPPPVDTDAFAATKPGDKRRVILSVGRFFASAHNKKHPAMLKAFRRMCDRGLVPDGWQYHLAGKVHRERRADLEYFAEVERLSRGYPIKLLPDLCHEDLLDEYRRASIFWHATGWGESERRHPERMEHFGLTTCEAMSCGCIPVVIAKAGQLETVDHGETGFLFATEADLVRHTKDLMDSYGTPRFDDMMKKARLAAMRFSKTSFEERLLALFDSHRLLAQDPPSTATAR